MTAEAAFLDQLERAIALTGVDRYRFLCLEHADPRVRADYRRLVTAIASGQHDPLSTPPASSSRPCCGGAFDPYAR
jgi:hypothetical protein